MAIQNIIDKIDTVYGIQDSEQEKNYISIYLNGFSQIKFPREFLRSLLLTIRSDQTTGLLTIRRKIKLQDF